MKQLKMKHQTDLEKKKSRITLKGYFWLGERKTNERHIQIYYSKWKYKNMYPIKPLFKMLVVKQISISRDIHLLKLLTIN